MILEIERKFLVHHQLWNELSKPMGLHCIQTYIHKDLEKTVRIRTLGPKGFITIKGKQVGISKPEFEYEIPLNDAQEMIHLFGEKTIEKVRYIIPNDHLKWEVDVFLGDNEGLIVAEIELQTDDEHFDIPNWIAEEVTHDYRYSNSNLQNLPFKKWEAQKI